MTMDRAAVRIGVLGAARIAPLALVRPARENPRAAVTAVAARDLARAEHFAQRHGIPEAYGDYRALLDDPDVDAVYIPLPNALHGRWALAALAAGKHVLCEKPFTANADEAQKVAAAAHGTGLVVMEAFHYRYHPLAARMKEIVSSGELGTLRHVAARFCFPLPRFADIRYDYALAGGALMDAGCYAVHMARLLGGAEPEVVDAVAKRRTPEVDRAMRATLRFPAGHTGEIRCSMWSADLLAVSARAVGDRGELRVVNPLAPQAWHRFIVRTAANRRSEHFPRHASYAYQLDAFVRAVRDGAAVLTPPSDSVANMAVIDSVYTAAGMALRHPGGVPAS
ncbi:MAG TPA: Gfo/Idh/MocA family oxidoreductase [Streptosporangiales bacterium]